MVVRIRLQRFGAKKFPFFRMVIADARAKRDGKFIEKVGTYNPIPSKDATKEIFADSERIKYWISVGAQPSYRVSWLLGKIGILPPQVPKASDPERHGVPKKIYKKMIEEKYAAIAAEHPTRGPARAAAAAEGKKRAIARYKKKKMELELAKNKNATS